MAKKWHIAERIEDDVIRQLLVNRGIAEEDAEAFLVPKWEAAHEPSLFTRMPEAVARLFAAIEQGEKIVIHGDYDADGVSGSSLLSEAIREIGARMEKAIDISVYLPDREKDGYGVAMHTIVRLAEEGTKLLVTVDCGIANADQLDRAHELGVDVIVCDHHQLGDRLPLHAVLLHPLAPGETYPNKTLCGTGVAFKFAWGLIDEARKRGADFPPGHEKWFLDLVAIATVTDVMPLLGENRILEHFGLKVLRKTRRVGLQAILQSAGASLASVDTETIGFRIGPRLNAAGRLASADHAFNAITAPTMAEAMQAAAQLEALNTRRQDIFARAYEEAKKLIVDQHDNPVLVVWKEDWLPGIVGLIAGRLVSDYGVPAFAMAKVGDHFVGSGRTAGGLHLVEAMVSCGDIFMKRGGHPQACGLSIATVAQVELFKERVCTFASEKFNGSKPEAIVHIDAVLPLAACTWDVYERMQALAPFGEGNRAPIFAAYNLEVLSAECMGSKQNHLRLTVYDEAGQLTLIGFGFGELKDRFTLGTQVNVAYALEINEWRGKRTLQYRIIDLVIV